MPCIKWKRYQTLRPTTAEIQLWFTRWPGTGMALVLGPLSRVFVIDVDGPDAHQALLQHLGDVPVAPLALSGSRKAHRYHLYFRHPNIETRAKATPWHPQLEFRGNGGLVVLPPSPHKSGKRYAWAPGRAMHEIDMPEVPAAVLDALVVKATIAPACPPFQPMVLETVVRGTLPLEVAASTRAFLNGEFSEASGWNNRLFTAACDMNARGYLQEQAEPLLLTGAKPRDDEEKDKALRSVASAFSQPRKPSRA
jgi:hypothetical protein